MRLRSLMSRNHCGAPSIPPEGSPVGRGWAGAASVHGIATWSGGHVLVHVVDKIGIVRLMRRVAVPPP